MTKSVTIGGKGITKKTVIGGNNPITVQTMWKDSIVDVCENTTKLESILKQINAKTIFETLESNLKI